MVKITAKRSENILPTRIDKDALSKLGQILKKECSDKQSLSISLYSDSSDIEIEDCKEFQNVEVPSDTYSIRMALSDIVEFHSIGGFIVGANPIEIWMDMRQPKNSKVRVKGENNTWVSGVTSEIMKAFERKKLGYWFIAKYEFTRTLLSWFSSAVFGFYLGFALWHFGLEIFYAFIIALAFFGVMTSLLKRFFDWVFPYFEIGNDDFKPRKFRRAVFGILITSGLLPAILLKLIGF
jgi:hypothetical protein